MADNRIVNELNFLGIILTEFWDLLKYCKYKFLYPIESYKSSARVCDELLNIQSANVVRNPRGCTKTLYSIFILLMASVYVSSLVIIVSR